jgi:hypothetical protein
MTKGRAIFDEPLFNVLSQHLLGWTAPGIFMSVSRTGRSKTHTADPLRLKNLPL